MADARADARAEARAEARARRRPRGEAWRGHLAQLLAFAIATAPGAAFAGPKGGNVAKGKATIAQQGSHTQIDTYQKKTIIDWRSFDVGSNETVRIEQPSANARTLNRVKDASVTQIDGSVSSNGQVWIVNPAGVYFGGQAKVLVQSLVAGAGDVSNEDFDQGTQRFTNLAGEVTNDGSIIASDGVTLAGIRVANVGQIVARDGNLVMAAGDEVWVTRHDTYVQVRIDGLAAAAGADTASVENAGRLEASRGSARLAAGDFLGLAIKNTGNIRAREIALAGGDESIVEIAGSLDARGDAPGQQGGRIEVQGEFINVENAVLDASGDAGGGTILIGGARGGRGDMATAEGTFVHANTELRADATRAGDGGEIVVFAEEVAAAHGVISAEGGPTGGRGGFVETSARVIDVSADVRVGGTDSDSGIDSDGSAHGASGTWLIDPVNVEIVDADDIVPVPGDPFRELLEIGDGNDVTYAPGGEPTNTPETSFVSAQSIVDTLSRGGDVTITTKSEDPSQPGTAPGNIDVNAPIAISKYEGPPTDLPKIAPGTFSLLTLRAANDINVNQPIFVETDADLTIGVTLRANDNQEMAFVDGQFQVEPVDQKRIGTVTIKPNAVDDTAPMIHTNGGFLDISAANVKVDGGIDTGGGVVDMLAFDLGLFFPKIQKANPSTDDFGRIDVNAAILTGGGNFTSQCACEDFVVTASGKIDVTEPEPDDDATAEIRLERDGEIRIEGQLRAERIRMHSGDDGAGDLVLGKAGGTGALLEAREIDLEAGDGRDPSGAKDDSQALARIVVHDDVRIAAIDPEDGSTVKAPDSFLFTQDAAITDADLPAGSQFGDALAPGVAGMLYVIQTRDGSGTTAPDLVVGDAAAPVDSKFDGADLVLLAPDTIELGAEIQPATAELILDNAFTVTSTLADRLRPTTGLRLRAGAQGVGDLDFAQAGEAGGPVTLVAPEIGLRAGSGTGDVAQVNIEGDTELTGGDGGPLEILEVIQDGDLASANIPFRSQLLDYDDVPDLSGLRLSLLSGGGSLTLAEVDVPKVEGSYLTLTALDALDILPPPADPDAPLPVPNFITVERANVGGLFDFEVTQDLLDKIHVTGSEADPRTILTLHATAGHLSFASAGTADVFAPVVVEADVIELIGDTIDLHTNVPVFETLDDEGDAISPERFIYHQRQLIDDSNAPTVENFPDGEGPSEYMVFQSDGNAGQLQILLEQSNENNVTNPPTDTRGWSFPLQPTTILALVAPGISVARTDGFDLILSEFDTFYARDLEFVANFLGDPTQDPLGEAVIDAKHVGRITGFDETLDFTPIVAPTIVVDGETVPWTTTTALENFRVEQDASFLRGGASLLPDFTVQPEAYTLTVDRGGVEIDNARFAGTNLSIVVQTVEELFGAGELRIDFEKEKLEVLSFSAQVSTSSIDEDGDVQIGEFVVDADAWVEADDSITLRADGAGPLRFAGPDESILLDAPALTLLADGDTSSFIDAATNAPRFRNTETFTFKQGTSILNGLLPAADGPDFGAIPAKEQFETPDSLENYLLQAIAGDIEINDPSDLLIATSLDARAGSTAVPGRITLRADIDAPGELNLILIDGRVRDVHLAAGEISLEAPRGKVVAGDPRATFEMLGSAGKFAIRQHDAITAADGGNLADARQIIGTLISTEYSVQSLQEVTVGAEFAARVERTNLVLKAGLLAEDFDAALGAVRGEEPSEDFPDAIYDRFADFDHDGVVDEDDRDALALIEAFVQIADPDETVDLTLRSLRIESTPDDAAPIRVGAANILTEANQTYRDQILLVADVDDEGNTIPVTFQAQAGLFTELNPTETPPASSLTFEYEIDGLLPFAQAFVASASNLITFGGDIGGTTALGDLILNLQQIVTFTTEAPIAAVAFGGGSEAPDFRVRARNIALNPESGTKGSVFENPDVPQIAILFHEGGDLSFETAPGGTFTMGVNQKLATNGSTLEINTSGPLDAEGRPIFGPSGSATIGDLSALDRIRVASGDIHLQRRKGGGVERANGRTVEDRGTDIVASEIDFFFDYDATTDPDGSKTLRSMQVGQGKDVRFGVAETTQTPAFLGDFQVLDLQYNLLTSSGEGSALRPILDGTPDGISRTDLSRVFLPAAPAVEQTVLAAYRVSNADELAAIGVRLEPATPAELRARARGATIYQDLDSTAGGDSALVSVSEDRLVAVEIDEARALQHRIFGDQNSNAPHVREALQSAVDDYRRSTGARRIVGFELRRYIYNRPSTQYEAYQALHSLDALFRHHRRSGLTPAEYGAIQRDWLRRVQPEGITIDQMAELVNPSRYIRGSDVLDIFAD